jgi:hypothetical protein
MCVNIYIHINRERDRDREREIERSEQGLHVCQGVESQLAIAVMSSSLDSYNLNLDARTIMLHSKAISLISM